MEILEYSQEFENDVLSTVERDPDWALFTDNQNRNYYKESLKNSIAYVCYEKNEFCGYIRAVKDDGFAVYISELYVKPKWRNKKIGQFLIERTKKDNPTLTIYALSDEDEYYLKKGYKKAGSVFEV